MFKSFCIVAACSLAFAGCGNSDRNGSLPIVPVSCSSNAQKQFVLDTMNDVYFWNELLPLEVDLDLYNTPEELLAFLVSFQPLDEFSFIDSAAADAQFFGEGKFQGYGFSTRFLAADDLRFTRVFESSPAAQAGFQRGDRILMLDGRNILEIENGEGIAAAFAQPTLVFTVRRLDGSEFTVSVDQDLVTIDPLPQWRIIDTSNGTSVGYIEFATFISTADAEFETIFAAFAQAGISDVIIDLRYNGGGLISTTEVLGDYLGGAIANNLVFSKTLFNDDNAGANRISFFQQLASSISLSRLVVITSSGTASASELIANSMEPHAEVTLVGSTTLGKPVGQLGIAFCEKILRPTAFETVNANDEGGYYDGLTVDCPAVDDLSIAVGDAADPNMLAALTLLGTGACPAPTQQSGTEKLDVRRKSKQAESHSTPWREFADAW